MSKLKKFWSSLWAPVSLVLGACAACCAVPVIAIVLGAGAATTAAAIIEPIAGAAMAAAVVLAAVILFRRWQARSTAACDPNECKS